MHLPFLGALKHKTAFSDKLKTKQKTQTSAGQPPLSLYLYEVDRHSLNFIPLFLHPCHFSNEQILPLFSVGFGPEPLSFSPTRSSKALSGALSNVWVGFFHQSYLLMLDSIHTVSVATSSHGTAGSIKLCTTKGVYFLIDSPQAFWELFKYFFIHLLACWRIPIVISTSTCCHPIIKSYVGKHMAFRFLVLRGVFQINWIFSTE